MLQVIAENLNTAVVSDLNTLAKSIRDDRRKVRVASSSFEKLTISKRMFRLFLLTRQV